MVFESLDGLRDAQQKHRFQLVVWGGQPVYHKDLLHIYNCYHDVIQKRARQVSKR